MLPWAPWIGRLNERPSSRPLRPHDYHLQKATAEVVDVVEGVQYPLNPATLKTLGTWIQERHVAAAYGLGLNAYFR